MGTHSARPLDPPIHRNNNTLDLLISDEVSKLKPICIKLCPHLSDHCTISALFNIKRGTLPIKEICFRDYENVDADNLIHSMELDEIEATTLDELLQNFETSVTKCP